MACPGDRPAAELAGERGSHRLANGYKHPLQVSQHLRIGEMAHFVSRLAQEAVPPAGRGAVAHDGLGRGLHGPYHQQVKRKLGQRYRLDPGMDDQEYVNALAGYNPALDKDELLSLLKRLKRKDIREVEMVSLAAEASKWIDN